MICKCVNLVEGRQEVQLRKEKFTTTKRWEGEREKERERFREKLGERKKVRKKERERQIQENVNEWRGGCAMKHPTDNSSIQCAQHSHVYKHEQEDRLELLLLQTLIVKQKNAYNQDMYQNEQVKELPLHRIEYQSIN